MLNVYPDSIGKTFSDTVSMLQLPEFKNVFSLIYVLPTFFNSDLDRGFSIINYDLNQKLVSLHDLEVLGELGIKLKLDIVLNHLSVASPQFRDLLQYGEQSKYKDFFINWNHFWEGHGELDEEGVIIPKKEFLDRLFMRKASLPILKVVFPNGTEQPYWNTFYKEVKYNTITANDLKNIEGLTSVQIQTICKQINNSIINNKAFETINFDVEDKIRIQIIQIIKRNRSYLGQMDVNANSELV